MEKNFFSSVAALDITGSLQLIISKGAAGDNLVVSVMVNNSGCGDNAKAQIVPFNLNATPEELDEKFFEQMTAPIQAASGLMVNMEAYLKQLEEAKKKSAMEKDKTEKERKDKEAKEKKYKEAIQKVDELEKAGKFKEAWMKMPDAAEYPEQAEIIRKRKSALSSKFAPDLFAAATAEDADTAVQDENTSTAPEAVDEETSEDADEAFADEEDDDEFYS